MKKYPVEFYFNRKLTIFCPELCCKISFLAVEWKWNSKKLNQILGHKIQMPINHVPRIAVPETCYVC